MADVFRYHAFVTAEEGKDVGFAVPKQRMTSTGVIIPREPELTESLTTSASVDQLK